MRRSFQKYGKPLEKEDCGSRKIFVGFGVSVVLSAVIHVVALGIAYKRYCYRFNGNVYIVFSEIRLFMK